MENEIVEILKAKEIEMDLVIEEARKKAENILDEAGKKLIDIQNNLFQESENEIKKNISDEEEKFRLEIVKIKTENEEKLSRVQEYFNQNKRRAIEFAISRLTGEILDKENDKTSNHRAQNPA